MAKPLFPVAGEQKIVSGAQSPSLAPIVIGKLSFSIMTWRDVAQIIIGFGDSADCSDSQPDGLATVAQNADGTLRLDLMLRSLNRSKLPLSHFSEVMRDEKV